MPSSLWWRQALTQSAVPAWNSTPLVIGKPALKTLGSLGHAIFRFLESHKPLIRHVHKHAHDSMAVLYPWLPEASAAAASLENSQGLFGTALSWDDRGISIQRLWLSPEELEAILTLLPKSAVPDHLAIPENASPMNEPLHANAAIWPALLRLPLLKGYWTQQLRSNLLETLLQLLPHAWLLDPAPIPNGAVIAGLNIPSWESMEHTPATGSRFTVTPAFAAANAFKPLSSSEVSSGLAQYPGQPAVLSLSPTDTENVIFSLYQQTEKGVSLLRAVHLRRSENGHDIAAGDVVAK